MKNILIIIIGIALAPLCNAQKVQGKVKSFSDLKGSEMVNVEFSYDGMGVGKFDKEEDYVSKKVKDYNEKEAGSGDKWKKAWLDDRSNRFHPEFLNLLNKYAEGKINFVQDDKNAEYTLIVNTTYTEPGFNVGVVRKNAFVDLAVQLVKTSDKTNSIGTVNLLKSPGRGGMGYDFDTGYRIEQAYAKAGKTLAKEMAKAGIL